MAGPAAEPPRTEDATADRDGELTVVGSGFLGPGQITAEARSAIERADRVLHVVGDPVTRQWLEERAPDAESLYDAYGAGKPRMASYREMVARLLAPLRRGERVCGVFYGHPGVFVHPSHEAIRQARTEGYAARMLPAVSAEDCLWADLELDPSVDGCQSFEATTFLHGGARFDPTCGLTLWQIGAIGVDTFERRRLWSRRGLRLLVEVLLETYEPTHPAVLYQAADLPFCAPRIERLPLAEIAAADVSTVTTLYLPPHEPAEGSPERSHPFRKPIAVSALQMGTLILAGTGYHVAGQIDELSEGYMAWADRLFYLVGDPATACHLRTLNPHARSLHDAYRPGEPGADAAARMTARVLAPLERGLTVCAAFSGHPAIGLVPPHDALRAARAAGHHARMLPAVSCEDCLFADLGIDPAVPGRTLLDATDLVLRPRRLNTATHLVLLQAGAVGVRAYRDDTTADRDGLRALARVLLRFYPPRHEAVIYETAPLPFCSHRREVCTLERLAAAPLRVHSTLWLPPLPFSPDPALRARLARVCNAGAGFAA